MGFTRRCVTCFLSSCCSQCQKVFTVSSLHINNVFAKKRGIAKKIIQTVRALMIFQNNDLVAGDFNVAAWRCRSRDNLSSIFEAFADCALLTPPGPTPLWGPGSIPDNWADVCGFLKLPGVNDSGGLANMALSLYLDKVSVCAPVIKMLS